MTNRSTSFADAAERSQWMALLLHLAAQAGHHHVGEPIAPSLGATEALLDRRRLLLAELLAERRLVEQQQILELLLGEMPGVGARQRVDRPRCACRRNPCAAAVATSLSSRDRLGLVGRKLFLTFSMTPWTSGSNDVGRALGDERRRARARASPARAPARAPRRRRGRCRPPSRRCVTAISYPMSCAFSCSSVVVPFRCRAILSWGVDDAHPLAPPLAPPSAPAMIAVVDQADEQAVLDHARELRQAAPRAPAGRRCARARHRE